MKECPNNILPFVSVIVAVYNKAPYLRETLNCIINQTLENIEILLIDDGSTDGSCNILEEYAEKDNRIILLKQENAGPGSARNEGLAAAKGDYLAFLDADDIYGLNMLEKMYRKAEKEDCDIVICDFRQLDTITNKIIPGGWGINYRGTHHCKTHNPRILSKYLFQAYMFWAWDKLFKREFVLRHSVLFPSLYGPEDFVFVAPLILSAERIGIVERIFVTHRINDYSSVENTRSKSIYDYAKATRMVKDFMEKHDIYELYEQSFINWSLMYSIWSMNAYIERHDINETLADSFKEVFNYNKTTFFGELNIDKYSEDYFYNNADYREYRNIVSMPFDLYILRSIADRLEGLRSSRSWRIGRAITWFLRKVRSFFVNKK